MKSLTFGRNDVSTPLATPEANPDAGPASTPVASAAGPSSIADIFPVRIQASLFVLLIAFLGFIGWKTWQPAATAGERAAAVGSGKVDLNRADHAELLLLSGIGPGLADKIVEYREKHGPFEGLGDLRKVPGIGPATLEALRPRVVLSWTDRAEPKSVPGPSVVTYAPAAMSSKSAETGAMLDPN